MPNVLVRDLPLEVHVTLQRRAQAEGRSLQQYLVAELTRLSAQPTLDELFARVERRRGGSIGFQEAADDLEAERAAR